MNLLERTDETYMQIALREAEKAFAIGEVPIGAVVVYEKQIIAKAHNQVEILNDATAHAEILAITQASSHLQNWRLSKACLYVTKEPCAMCAGAMVNSKLNRLVFGASDPKYGAAGGALNVTNFDGHLHQINIKSGVFHEECLGLLKRFFQQRRNEKKI